MPRSSSSSSIKRPRNNANIVQGTEEEETLASINQRVYAQFFMKRGHAEGALVEDILREACESLAVTFVEGIIPRRTLLEDFSLQDFAHALRRLRAFASKRDLVERTFDILAENGKMSREDIRGYEMGPMPPIASLRMTTESFYRGLQRLNVKAPKEMLRWMLQVLTDPDGEELEARQVPELMQGKWAFGDFARMLLRTGIFIDPHRTNNKRLR